jgi:ribulose kinase
MPFSLGIDFGTNSVRSIVADCSNGKEFGGCVIPYPSGKNGVLIDPRDHHVARQRPGDYLEGLEPELAASHRPQYIAQCGNVYSSEWFWSKIWKCLSCAPDVFDASYSWVELSDFIPSELGGITDPQKIVRGICAAGHKALYSDDPRRKHIPKWIYLGTRFSCL